MGYFNLRLFGPALLSAACLAALDPAAGLAQEEEKPAVVAPAGPQPVTIKREALTINDPLKYNVPLKTAPNKVLEIAAPMDGFVKQVQLAAGEKVSAQAEALRLDDSRQKLILEKARALVQAAKIEVKIAEAKQDADQEALAKARLEAALADLKLAENELERTLIKIPFNGELFRVHVVAGQFVRAGDPLMTLAETSHLIAEVPVDRTKHKPGSDISLTVEQTEVKAKVQALLPADARFEPMRNLVPSLASAIVKIDNSQGKFFAAQTVFMRLIPRQPFTQVPTVAVGNHADGRRLVQVIRQGIVRDIPVGVLTQAGTDRVFVSGPFGEGDELIVTSSQPLKDGQQVRLQTVAAAPAAPAAGAATAPAAKAAGGF